MNPPRFIMMTGLPGSGKTKYAKSIAYENEFIIYSSDSIRKSINGDENCQENNDEVFRILHKNVKDSLKNGINTIYDATNINSKRRRAFLWELKRIPCIKECIIMAVPYMKCCTNNIERSRFVPYKVIRRMSENWNTPYWFEGWDKISIVYPYDYSKDSIDVEEWIRTHDHFPQHNEHHSMSLGKHCNAVGEYFKESDLLRYAGYLHDCGKPLTKTFRNSKGELTKDAHYYNHHCAGAYYSLFFKFPQNIDKLDVSILINLHMFPYFWEKDKNHEEKMRRKYQKIWGDELYNNVIKLHQADVIAH